MAKSATGRGDAGEERRFSDMKVFVGDLSIDEVDVTATAAELNILDGVTATAAEINAAADVSGKIVQVTNADYTVLAANSGKPHLVANVSADRTFTLPSVSTGLDYEFIAQVSAADGHDWIIDAGSDTNFFVGAVTHLDTDASTDGLEVASVPSDGTSNSTIQVNVPAGGTRVRMICDGVNWTIEGTVVSTTAPAFGNQA